VISHLDTRATEERRNIREDAGDVGYVGSKVFPNLLWMKKHQSSRFGKVRHVLDIREYVGFLLTGEFTHDVMSMEQEMIEKLSGYVGVDSGAFGSGHDSLHPAGLTSERAERRFGIEKGVPVLQAPGDTVCASVGSGLGKGDAACDVTGSTEVIAALLPEGAAPKTSRLYQIPHFVEGRFFLFSSPPHGFIFKWFVDTFYGHTPKKLRYAAVDKEVASVDASESNPLFVPLIRTGGYSYQIENQFFQMGASHTRAQLARSVMEGLAMRVRMAMDGIRESGIPIRRVRLSGGGATSEVWNQIRTDVFGIASELIQTRETSSLGAAMIASVAAGRYRDIFEAESKMVHVTRVFRPKESRVRTYDSIYARFKRRLEALETSAS
jgi:xylulokinase